MEPAFVRDLLDRKALGVCWFKFLRDEKQPRLCCIEWENLTVNIYEETVQLIIAVPRVTALYSCIGKPKLARKCFACVSGSPPKELRDVVTVILRQSLR